MLQTRELLLPHVVFHFNDQGIAHQRRGPSAPRDFLSRRDRPSGSYAGFRIGDIRRKLQFSDEAAGAFHKFRGWLPGEDTIVACSPYHTEVSRLILASASPRRAELLRRAGLEFSVRSRPVEEIRRAGEEPELYARRLARWKAQAAWESADEIVLGADTIVVAGNRVLEKPAGSGDARAMLRILSGKTHAVITGICLIHPGGEIIDSAETLVHFAELSDREIDDYIASGEPMDKAGAYGIQGLASKFVDRIEGCFFNVMGLPLPVVYRHLKSLEASSPPSRARP